MKRFSMVLAGAAAALLFLAQPVVASQDTESELAQMRELVKGLQQQVDAQQEQIAHQGELLEDAHKAVKTQQQESKALSGLAKFLESVQVDGGVAGSYFWNFNRPEKSTGSGGGGAGSSFPGNRGNNGRFLVFHPDHNTFQVDQVYLGFGKPATQESRGGFRFDTVWGQTADARKCGTCSWDEASTPIVHQAYAEYLAPLGDGVNVRLGKFASLVGNESLNAAENYHITYSNMYNLLQPIDHLGVTGSAMLGPVRLTLGFANSSTVPQVSTNFVEENNKEKTYMVQAAYSQDQLGVRGTLLYGAEDDGSHSSGTFANGEKNGLFNVVATFDPSDQLALWLNADYAWIQGRATAAFGIAAGARMAVNDRMGVALRGEYDRDKQNYFGIGDGGVNSGSTTFCTAGPAFARCDAEIYSMTGTVDYTLVDNLVLKSEIRWDQVRQRGTNEFPVGWGDRDRRSQVLIGAQLAYVF